MEFSISDHYYNSELAKNVERNGNQHLCPAQHCLKNWKDSEKSKKSDEPNIYKCNSYIFIG
jgi:hypothetical protein